MTPLIYIGLLAGGLLFTAWWLGWLDWGPIAGLAVASLGAVGLYWSLTGPEKPETEAEVETKSSIQSPESIERESVREIDETTDYGTGKEALDDLDLDSSPIPRAR